MTKRRIGPYEWFVLWATVNNGGRTTINELKESISGYTSASSSTMLTPLYKQTERLNKAIIRACRSLHRKGLIFLEEAKPHIYSAGTKPVNVLLREEGLRIAHLYAMPRSNPAPNQVPYVSIVTDATESPVFTYDSTGQLEASHTLEPITREQYFQLHNVEPLEAT